MFDVQSIRSDFPILSTSMNGLPFVYLDNAATSQKPQTVIDAVSNYYQSENANIHRGVFKLSEEATARYEETRASVAQFISAQRAEEIIFTKGVTESINLIANGFAQTILKPGDEILISGMEHHANIVPWQIACERTGSVLNVIPVLDDGSLDMEAYGRLLSKKTKIVSIVHISNSLGTINPLSELIERAHAQGVPVLVDAAQSLPHAR